MITTFLDGDVLVRRSACILLQDTETVRQGIVVVRCSLENKAGERLTVVAGAKRVLNNPKSGNPRNKNAKGTASKKRVSKVARSTPRRTTMTNTTTTGVLGAAVPLQWKRSFLDDVVTGQSPPVKRAKVVAMVDELRQMYDPHGSLTDAQLDDMISTQEARVTSLEMKLLRSVRTKGSGGRFDPSCSSSSGQVEASLLPQTCMDGVMEFGGVAPNVGPDALLLPVDDPFRSALLEKDAMDFSWLEALPMSMGVDLSESVGAVSMEQQMGSIGCARFGVTRV